MRIKINDGRRLNLIDPKYQSNQTSTYFVNDDKFYNRTLRILDSPTVIANTINNDPSNVQIQFHVIGGGVNDPFAANVVAVYVADHLVQANANLNFNNTATVNVSVTPNGINRRANISFNVPALPNISAQANAAYNVANSAYAQANLAYAAANAAGSGALNQANAAFDQANSAFGQANAAFTRANDAYVQANNSFVVANAANVSAQTAINLGIDANTYAQTVYIVANTAINNAANANVVAQTAISLATSANTTGQTGIFLAQSANAVAQSAISLAGDAINAAANANLVAQSAITLADSANTLANTANSNASNASLQPIWVAGSLIGAQRNINFVTANTANLVISGTANIVNGNITVTFDTRVPTGNGGGGGDGGNVEAAYIQANNAFAQANLAFTAANVANQTGQTAISLANAGNTYAQTLTALITSANTLANTANNNAANAALTPIFINGTLFNSRRNINFTSANTSNLIVAGLDNTTPGNVTVTFDTRLPNAADTANLNLAYNQANTANALAQSAITLATDAALQPIFIGGVLVGARKNVNFRTGNTANLLLTGIDNTTPGNITVTFDTRLPTNDPNAANLVAIYQNDALVMANANINFNNTSTVNVAISANADNKRANISFTVPASSNAGNVGVVSLNSGITSVSNTVAATAYSANLASLNPIYVDNAFIGAQRNVNFVSANAGNIALTGTANITNGNITITIDTRTPPAIVEGTGDPAAYAQANAAYNQANLSANLVAIYVNNALVMANANVNFINTSDIIVTVIANGANKQANISFNIPELSNAYVQANTANVTAVAAYAKANASANLVAIYANDALVMANANVNFNNSSSVNVAITANAATRKANISFDVPNLGPAYDRANSALGLAQTVQSDLDDLIDVVNSVSNVSSNLVAIYANNTLAMANANVNFNNSASVLVVVSANATNKRANISFSVPELANAYAAANAANVTGQTAITLALAANVTGQTAFTLANSANNLANTALYVPIYVNDVFIGAQKNVSINIANTSNLSAVAVNDTINGNVVITLDTRVQPGSGVGGGYPLQLGYAGI